MSAGSDGSEARAGSADRKADIGVTGLAVMGRNLARNLARHGHVVSLHNRSPERTRSLVKEHGDEGTFVPSESNVEGWATRRFEVRPGITGLWQVSGRNDLTRNDLVQLDYLYVASWSLWWDLKIMFETPKTMARGTGAY